MRKRQKQTKLWSKMYFSSGSIFLDRFYAIIAVFLYANSTDLLSWSFLIRTFLQKRSILSISYSCVCVCDLLFIIFLFHVFAVQPTAVHCTWHIQKHDEIFWKTGCDDRKTAKITRFCKNIIWKQKRTLDIGKKSK